MIHGRKNVKFPMNFAQ